MYLPKKLATTMGIELTFMPTLFDEVYLNTKGCVKLWETSGESSTRQHLAYAFDRYNRARNFHDEQDKWKRRLFHRVGTDPHCIEVSTMPFATANSIRKAVREGYHIARTLQLAPRTMYTDGGGAHIHTGIPYSSYSMHDKREVYIGAMYAWAVENPWMAWAFAGKKDESNANAIRKGDVVRKTEKRNDADTIICLHQEMEYCKESIIEYTAEVHKRCNWLSGYSRRSMLRDIEDYQRSYMRYCVRFHKECIKLIAEMRADLEAYYAEASAPAAEYPMIHASKIRPVHGKGVMLRTTEYGDNGTLEFRCFLMPETAAAMDRHIMLVDAIVRRAKHIAETNEDGMLHEPCDVGDLRKMKYSRAKMGFRSMLVDLDLNPDEYRAECVNIALRMRARRNSYYV